MKNIRRYSLGGFRARDDGTGHGGDLSRKHRTGVSRGSNERKLLIQASSLKPFTSLNDVMLKQHLGPEPRPLPRILAGSLAHCHYR